MENKFGVHKSFLRRVISFVENLCQKPSGQPVCCTLCYNQESIQMGSVVSSWVCSHLEIGQGPLKPKWLLRIFVFQKQMMFKRIYMAKPSRITAPTHVEALPSKVMYPIKPVSDVSWTHYYLNMYQIKWHDNKFSFWYNPRVRYR